MDTSMDLGPWSAPISGYIACRTHAAKPDRPWAIDWNELALNTMESSMQ